MQAPHITVIGAGAFGGWTALHLLRKGCRVTLIDTWGPGNARASSGGETRVIRAIYGKDRRYSEMVARSIPRWEELNKISGQELFQIIGGLYLFSRDDDSYARLSIPPVKEAGLSLEEVPVKEMAEKYPAINFENVRTTFFEERAGFLKAKAACWEVVKHFVALGGIYLQAKVTPGNKTSDRLENIQLSNGQKLTADDYVFACGPWLPSLFPDVFKNYVTISRQEIHYFGIPSGAMEFTTRQMPVWLDFGERIFYGIPDVDGRGFKIADDTRQAEMDPETGERAPDMKEVEKNRRHLSFRFPELKNAPLTEARVCQYANSPDGHYVVDRHPEMSNVWLAGIGCGHGYKLGPALGELLSSAILTGSPLPDQFSIARLAAKQGSITQFD